MGRVGQIRLSGYTVDSSDPIDPMSCGNGGRKCTRDRLQLIGGRIHFGPSHLRGAGSVGVGPELYDLHTATGVNYIPRFDY